MPNAPTRRIARLARAFGPAMAHPHGAEPLRAALGAGLGLILCGVLIAWAGRVWSAEASLFLIAPLGATTFLLFAVPNSPLAQPWSAIVGNTISALVAVSVMQTGLPLTFLAGLAVGGAMLAMAFLRAMHPPGAAIALATVLGGTVAPGFGYGFAFMPVMLDTAILVGLAILFNRVTGRKYPFRQTESSGLHHTADPSPQRRLGLSGEDLAELLDRFNLSANIGAEDFGRVLAAAEEEAARRRFSGLRCADVMSRDVVSVRPGTALRVVADLFRRHRFKTLPVVDAERRFLGIITQNDLIQRARRDTLAGAPGFAAALSGLLRPDDARVLRARDIMNSTAPTVTPETPVGALISLLADGGLQAVAVLDQRRLVGVITRSDLLQVLARSGHAPAICAVAA